MPRGRKPGSKNQNESEVKKDPTNEEQNPNMMDMDEEAFYSEIGRGQKKDKSSMLEDDDLI